MAKAPFSDLLLYLRKICGSEAARDLTDAQLLERFQVSRDEVSFSVLVHRHGPMVLSVCRRVLGNAHAVEDAFQATFMILVRRQASISCKASLGGWLQLVAQRVATKARDKETIRHRRERRLEPIQATEPLDELTWQELRRSLDEEIGRLADKHRTPLVLCYLEGKSYDQAARELGWPKSTLTRRLSRARELLRQRLVRRGMTLSAGVLATALCEKVSGAPVGAMLVINTVKAACCIAAGNAVARGCASAGAVVLAKEAMGGMFASSGKMVVLVLAFGLAIGGAGLAGYSKFAKTEQPADAEKTQSSVRKIEAGGGSLKHVQQAVDVFGDPLPDGAVARLGTERFRHGGETVAYFDEGKTLAVAGHFEFGVCLFDASTGRRLHRVSVGFANTSAFSPDGKILLAGGDLQLVDIATGTQLGRLDGGGEDYDVAAVAFSPDGRTVAGPKPVSFSDPPKVINLWDVATRKLVRTLQGHSGAVMSVAFAPDGKMLASGSKDKTVRLWEVATGKELKRFEADNQLVSSVAFSPDGTMLASSGRDDQDQGKGQVLDLWQIKTGKLLFRLKPGDLFGFGPIAFSPDGKQLASAGTLGLVRVWDAETGTQLRQWQGPLFIRSIAFSPDAKELACTATQDSVIHRWDTASGKEIGPPTGHTGACQSLRFNEDGKTLFSCGVDGRVLEWNLPSGRQRRLLFQKPFVPALFWGSVGVSPDGATVAVSQSAEPNYRLSLWDSIKGKQTQYLSGHVGRVLGPLKFSPNGKFLASVGDDGVRLWESATGKLVNHMPEARDQVAFSPDGQFLASSGAKGNGIDLWDIATGKKLHSYSPQRQYFHVVFSPDGKSLAAAELGSAIHLWSATTEKELLRLRAPGQIYSLAFSTSGRVLATGALVRGAKNATSTISFWEVLSGQQIPRIDSPQGSVFALTFGPDGRTLASGGEDSTILLWDLAHRPKEGQLKASPLSDKQLDNLWIDLASDAAKAERAIWRLVLTPERGVPYLKKQMQVVPAPNDPVAKLLADLDSDRFADREKAAHALDALGESAESAMRKVLTNNPTLEMRRRLEPILAKRDKAVLRPLRAIDALDHAGTAEAREVLEMLARSAPNPRVAEGAKAALQRLAKR